jgi:hypothetical protein
MAPSTVPRHQLNYPARTTAELCPAAGRRRHPARSIVPRVRTGLVSESSSAIQRAGRCQIVTPDKDALKASAFTAVAKQLDAVFAGHAIYRITVRRWPLSLLRGLFLFRICRLNNSALSSQAAAPAKGPFISCFIRWTVPVPTPTSRATLMMPLPARNWVCTRFSTADALACQASYLPLRPA